MLFSFDFVFAHGEPSQIKYALHVHTTPVHSCRRAEAAEVSRRKDAAVPSGTHRRPGDLLHAHYRTGLVCGMSNTLGKGLFALGKPHSVKKVTAKALLPSVFFRALGKVFAECQKALGKLFETRSKKQRLKIAKYFFTW